MKPAPGIYFFSIGRSNPAFVFVKNNMLDFHLAVTNIRRSIDSDDLIRLKNNPDVVACWHVKYYGKEKRHNK